MFHILPTISSERSFLPQLLPLAAIWIRQMSFGGGVPLPSLSQPRCSPSLPSLLKEPFLRFNKLLSRGTRNATRTADAPRVYIWRTAAADAGQRWEVADNDESKKSSSRARDGEERSTRRPLFLTARGFVVVSTCTLFSHCIHCLGLGSASHYSVIRGRKRTRAIWNIVCNAQAIPTILQCKIIWWRCCISRRKSLLDISTLIN